MSVERFNDVNGEEKKLSRRNFLIKGAKIAAGGAVVGGLGGFIAGSEILKGKDGIVERHEGIYVPIYENHKIGIKPEDIPQDIDGLFREGRLSFPIVSRGIVGAIAKRNIPFVFGDVDTRSTFMVKGVVILFGRRNWV